MQYKTKPNQTVNKLKENAVIGKKKKKILIIGNKNIIVRTIVKITDIVKGMLTSQNLMKDQYLNCLYSNRKGTSLCIVFIVMQKAQKHRGLMKYRY